MSPHSKLLVAASQVQALARDFSNSLGQINMSLSLLDRYFQESNVDCVLPTSVRLPHLNPRAALQPARIYYATVTTYGLDGRSQK